MNTTGSAALAEGVWQAAKKREMLFEDIIGCCAILISAVSKNSGEPVDYLISEVRRRMPSNDRTQRRRDAGATNATETRIRRSLE